MNNNAVKTGLMFLAIIFFVLMGRLFWEEHELLVVSDGAQQVANVSCTEDTFLC